MSSAQRARGGWTKQPEEVRRRAIIDAAYACFAEKGFANTSVQHIAERAGLTKGGVYFHFESKDAIRAALIANFTDTARFQLDSEDVVALPPAERLREQIDRYLKGLKESGAAGLVTLAEAATRDQAGIAEIRAFFLAVSTQFAQTLQAGQAEGVFRGGAEPALLAELIITTLDGRALHEEFDASGVKLCTGGGRVLDLLMQHILTPSHPE